MILEEDQQIVSAKGQIVSQLPDSANVAENSRRQYENE